MLKASPPSSVRIMHSMDSGLRRNDTVKVAALSHSLLNLSPRKN